MGVVLAVRGTSLNARYSSYGKVPTLFSSGVAVVPVVTPDVGPGVFGGSVITVSNPTADYKGLAWNGHSNYSGNPAIAILARVVPRFTGVGSGSLEFFSGAQGPINAPGGNQSLQFYISATGQIGFYMTDDSGNVAIVTNTPAGVSFVSGTAIDIMFSWDGSATAGSLKVGIDGVLFASLNPVAAMSTRTNAFVTSINFGGVPGGNRCNLDLNELVVFDTYESVVYSPRSAFYTVPAFDGQESTDPGVANVKDTVAYEINGVSLVGTLVSTDPGEANVRSGTGYTIESVGKTGTLDLPAASDVKSGVVFDGGSQTGTLLSTDPGVQNVRLHTTYKINSVDKTGAYDVGNPAVEQDISKGTVKIRRGEHVEIFVQLLDKLRREPVSLTIVDEITANLPKDGGGVVAFTLTGSKITVSDVEGGKIKIIIDTTDSALLALGDSSSPVNLEIIVDQGFDDVSFYDYVGKITVEDPLVS